MRMTKAELKEEIEDLRDELDAIAEDHPEWFDDVDDTDEDDESHPDDW